MSAFLHGSANKFASLNSRQSTPTLPVRVCQTAVTNRPPQPGESRGNTALAPGQGGISARLVCFWSNPCVRTFAPSDRQDRDALSSVQRGRLVRRVMQKNHSMACSRLCVEPGRLWMCHAFGETQTVGGEPAFRRVVIPREDDVFPLVFEEAKRSAERVGSWPLSRRAG